MRPAILVKRYYVGNDTRTRTLLQQLVRWMMLQASHLYLVRKYQTGAYVCVCVYMCVCVCVCVRVRAYVIQNSPQFICNMMSILLSFSAIQH